MSQLDQITKIINSQKIDNDSTLDYLFDQLYSEVKIIANAQLRKVGGSEDHSATSLVNECFLKLKTNADIEVKNRKHFYAITARCMRFYLVDLYRQNSAQKNQAAYTVLCDEEVADEKSLDFDVMTLHLALARLEEIDSNLAQLVEMKFFGGFSFTELADLENSTKGQVYQQWLLAKSMLLSLVEDMADER